MDRESTMVIYSNCHPQAKNSGGGGASDTQDAMFSSIAWRPNGEAAAGTRAPQMLDVASEKRAAAVRGSAGGLIQ